MVKEFVDALFFANYETFVVKSDEKKNKVQGGRRVMYTSHHSIKDRMIAKLEEMYDEAEGSYEREEIRKEIRRIEAEK